MTRREFERLVEEGLRAIPEPLRRRVSNAAVVIEDEPSARVRRAQRLSRGQTLLGLYEGVPRTAREHYGVGGTLPDRITIFRRPIEAAAGGQPERMRRLVCETVWHEVAHHFGMDEAAVRGWEGRRRR